MHQIISLHRCLKGAWKLLAIVQELVKSPVSEIAEALLTKMSSPPNSATAFATASAKAKAKATAKAKAKSN